MNLKRYLARLVALLAAGGIGAVLATTVAATEPAPPLAALDIGFAQDMSAHHQQAVTMSDMISADASPEVRALAEQIRFTQLYEIGQMSGWLQLVGAPPNSPTPMAWMPGGHTAHGEHTSMMGMASPADLTRLQRGTGIANEILYLQLMMRHHQGGIDMAAQAARNTTTDVVRRVASLMVDEQTQETQVIQTLLSLRRSEPLPYP